jgi:hypothetical protein
MEQYMEDKCLYIRPNNKGLFDMNLICNITQDPGNKYYTITFTNCEKLSITVEEYEDLLEQMTEEYSYYDTDINEEEETDDCDNGEDIVCDYDTLFKNDNKINW